MDQIIENGYKHIVGDALDIVKTIQFWNNIIDTNRQRDGQTGLELHNIAI